VEGIARYFLAKISGVFNDLASQLPLRHEKFRKLAQQGIVAVKDLWHHHDWISEEQLLECNIRCKPETLWGITGSVDKTLPRRIHLHQEDQIAFDPCLLAQWKNENQRHDNKIDQMCNPTEHSRRLFS